MSILSVASPGDIYLSLDVSCHQGRTNRTILNNPDFLLSADVKLIQINFLPTNEISPIHKMLSFYNNLGELIVF